MLLPADGFFHYFFMQWDRIRLEPRALKLFIALIFVNISDFFCSGGKWIPSSEASHNACDLHNLNLFQSDDVLLIYLPPVDVIIDYEGIQIDYKLNISTETLANKLGLRLITIHLEFSSLLPSRAEGFLIKYRDSYWNSCEIFSRRISIWST